MVNALLIVLSAVSALVSVFFAAVGFIGIGFSGSDHPPPLAVLLMLGPVIVVGFLIASWRLFKGQRQAEARAALLVPTMAALIACLVFGVPF